MKHSELLSEAPVFTEYPRNEIVVELREGETRHLFVDNQRLARPHEAFPDIEEATRSYLADHEEAVAATIFRVENAQDRSPLKTVRK